MPTAREILKEAAAGGQSAAAMLKGFFNGLGEITPALLEEIDVFNDTDYLDITILPEQEVDPSWIVVSVKSAIRIAQKNPSSTIQVDSVVLNEGTIVFAVVECPQARDAIRKAIVELSLGD